MIHTIQVYKRGIQTTQIHYLETNLQGYLLPWTAFNLTLSWQYNQSRKTAINKYELPFSNNWKTTQVEQNSTLTQITFEKFVVWLGSITQKPAPYWKFLQRETIRIFGARIKYSGCRLLLYLHSPKTHFQPNSDLAIKYNFQRFQRVISLLSVNCS